MLIYQKKKRRRDVEWDFSNSLRATSYLVRRLMGIDDVGASFYVNASFDYSFTFQLLFKFFWNYIILHGFYMRSCMIN